MVQNTIEYIGLWEALLNPNFNPLEFEGFRKQAGLNAFTLSPVPFVTLEVKTRKPNQTYELTLAEGYDRGLE